MVSRVTTHLSLHLVAASSCFWTTHKSPCTFKFLSLNRTAGGIPFGWSSPFLVRKYCHQAGIERVLAKRIAVAIHYVVVSNHILCQVLDHTCLKSFFLSVTCSLSCVHLKVVGVTILRVSTYLYFYSILCGLRGHVLPPPKSLP